MNNIITILLLFALCGSSLSQVYTSTWKNDNSGLFVDATSSIHVNGDIIDSNFAIIDNRGLIELDRDWINNNDGQILFLNNSPGTVSFTGGDQQIKGNTVTDFHNLRLNNFNSIKSLYQDARVWGWVDLTDAELAVNNNVFYVNNAHTNAVKWTRGFVSGDSIGGYFVRNTTSDSSYMFPVGSRYLNDIYRAVELTPSNSDSSTFGVRLAYGDPSNDFTGGISATGATGPFPRTSLSSNLYDVNNQFYHHIARFDTTSITNSAIAKLYYFTQDNNLPYEFNSLAVWDNSFPRWDRDVFSVEFSAGLNKIGSPERYMQGRLSSFNNDVYAFAIKDKITARVPQIFSPNGDGINDFLLVLGSEIEKIEFIVYNRWGEKVFETKDQNKGWDGTFRGAPAQPGVYVYYLKANLMDNQVLSQSGDITLVR